MGMNPITGLPLFKDQKTAPDAEALLTGVISSPAAAG